MTYRTVFTFVVLMIWLAVFLILSGCASTEMHKAPDGTLSWKSSTLWKDIDAVNAKADGVNFSLGRSATSENAANPAIVACLIAPQLEGCPK